jgi:hypothetical protein
VKYFCYGTEFMKQFAVNLEAVPREAVSLVDQIDDNVYANARMEVIAHDLDDMNLQWRPLLK